MGFDDFLFWPFALAFTGIGIIIAILVAIFWVWMIIDCAKRKFKNDLEKIIWLIVIVLGSWIGALVYFIAVRMYNPRGIARK